VRPVALAFALAGCLAFAQEKSNGPRFEVASVRLGGTVDQSVADRMAGKPVPATGVTFSGRRIDIVGLNVKSQIARAWRIPMQQVVAPDWTMQALVVIHAEMPEGATREQLPEMLKALLEERFHLTAHRATAEQPAYALVRGKGALKLNPPREMDLSACETWKDDGSLYGGRTCRKVESTGASRTTLMMYTAGPVGPTRSDATFQNNSDGITRQEYFRATMAGLAERLSLPCGNAGTCPGLPVVDRTGLPGEYDLVLEGACSREACDTDASKLEKLGLKLERTTASIERLIVDQLDKVPTEN